MKPVFEFYPSAYDVGELLTQLPIGTAGHLSFSRNTPAERIAPNGDSETVGNNMPRIMHDESCPYFLAERQSTNLFLNDNGDQDVTILNATEYSFSFFGSGSISLTNATTQVVVGDANNRTIVTFTSASTILATEESGNVFDVQMELGQPTTFIPTTTIAVTRLAETGVQSGDLSSVINSSEGCFYLDALFINEGRTITISSGFTSNRVRVGKNPSGSFNLRVSSGGVNSNINSISTFEGINKIAAIWGAGVFKLFIDGILVAQGLTTSPNGLNNIQFSYGSGDFSPVNAFEGKVLAIKIYDKAPTDAQAIQLTTVGYIQ